MDREESKAASCSGTLFSGWAPGTPEGDRQQGRVCQHSASHVDQQLLGQSQPQEGFQATMSSLDHILCLGTLYLKL